MLVALADKPQRMIAGADGQWSEVFRVTRAASHQRMFPARRLTAILAADVAGYSRPMGADEEGTLDNSGGHLRALIEPKIPPSIGTGSPRIAATDSWLICQRGRCRSVRRGDAAGEGERNAMR